MAKKTILVLFGGCSPEYEEMCIRDSTYTL